jgi:tRNA (guanine-N1)-methyltransferase
MSLLSNAPRKKRKLPSHVHDLRDYTDDKKHRKVDDRPFGGGPGMVMMPGNLYSMRLKPLKADVKQGDLHFPGRQAFFTISRKTLDRSEKFDYYLWPLRRDR